MTSHLTRPAPTGHGVLVPDVHGRLSQPLELLIDLLVDVQTWSDDQGAMRSPLALPGMLVARSTLQSIQRLVHLLEPIQCRPGSLESPERVAGRGGSRTRS
jgi:hypothetical protein